METSTRDRVRRGVRAAVYRACWRRLEGDEPGAQALLSCEVPAALSASGESGGVDDELVRAWLDEDAADFDRAVLISELVARRTAGAMNAVPSPVRHVAAPLPSAPERPARAAVHSPAIADLLEGMLAQERRIRVAS